MNNDTYDDRFSRIKKDLYILEGKFNELEHDFTSLKSLLNTAIGSCNACAGTGMLYDVDEDAGRDLTRPCDHCKGTGKMPPIADAIAPIGIPGAPTKSFKAEFLAFAVCASTVIIASVLLKVLVHRIIALEAGDCACSLAAAHVVKLPVAKTSPLALIAPSPPVPHKSSNVLPLCIKAIISSPS